MTVYQVLSRDSDQMALYPIWLQPLDADPSIPISVADLRALTGIHAVTDGIVTSNDWKISQRGAGANYSVDITAGKAAIAGDNVTDQGRYMVRSWGTVNVPCPPPPVSGTRNHRIVAQVLDTQVDATGSYMWRFWVEEDTGSGIPGVPNNGVSIGALKATAGVAGYTTSMFTDLRFPCGNIMGASVSAIASTPFATNTYVPVTWVTEDNDPWNLFSSSDPTKLLLRGSGLWDLQFSVDVDANVDKECNAYITYNGDLPTTSFLAHDRRVDNGNNATLNAQILGEKLTNDTTSYIQAYVWSNDPTPHYLRAKLRAYRRAYVG